MVLPLNIQVAALMTGPWVDRKLKLPEGVRFDRVILPGHCRGDVSAMAQRLGVSVEIGPTDLQDLPEFLGGKSRREGYGGYDIQIIAEINDAPRLSVDAIIEQAMAYRDDGADVIDIGCDPQSDRPAWSEVATVVRELRSRDLRVSIDTFHVDEIAAAASAGAELVLSVNASNRDAASDWGCEVVVVPDDIRTLGGLDETITLLEKRNVKYRIDPILEPIGFGFAASLGRYLETRARYPHAEMMMGVGNLTEMTEVDSAGVNALLTGFCQETGICSVLTTQVIHWARSSVRELDVARRLMKHAVSHARVPKRIDPRLLMLRDGKSPKEAMSDAALAHLASSLTDRNIRLLLRGKTLHAMNKDMHVTGDDPFELFDQMKIDDPSHAFYLGYELSKAVTAMTLGKRYTQDQALSWGLLTKPEKSHHERRRGGTPSPDAASDAGASESGDSTT